MSDEHAEVREQLQFVEWLRSHDMYNPYDSTLVLRKMMAVWRKVREDLKVTAGQHPYKQIGNRESYSQFNEGWVAACDAVECRLEPDATESA